MKFQKERLATHEERLATHEERLATLQTHELGLFVYLCGLFGHNQMKEPKDNFWHVRDVILKDFNRLSNGSYFNKRTR